MINFSYYSSYSVYKMLQVVAICYNLAHYINERGGKNSYSMYAHIVYTPMIIMPVIHNTNETV